MDEQGSFGSAGTWCLEQPDTANHAFVMRPEIAAASRAEAAWSAVTVALGQRKCKLLTCFLTMASVYVQEEVGEGAAVESLVQSCMPLYYAGQRQRI